jgi:hypothetical protein
VLRDDLAELRRRTDGGDRSAAVYLHNMLRARGAADELRERALAGDDEAAERLVPLLDEDELWREIDAGTHRALAHLAILLDEQGRSELAAALRRNGMTPGRAAGVSAIASDPPPPT